MHTQDLMECVRELILAAGQLTLQHFQSTALTVHTKGDGTPVTIADRDAESLLRRSILERFPDDTIIGEEHDDQLGTSGRKWVLDPIDGTKAFTRGVPLYSNLVYVEDQQGPLVGAINLPALGELIIAARGEGCWLNESRCSVSGTAGIRDAVITTCEFNHWSDAALLAIKHAGTAMRTWGDGYGYALVASGRVDAMVDPTINYWDVAPMSVIIPEAGGVVTTFEGSDQLDSTNCIATNGKIHSELLALVKQ
jgi:histidinol-phosphatase